MRKIAMWFWLLNKRLYKKITFVCILLLIPVLVVLFAQISQEESGMLRVLLSCEQEDAISTQIVDELLTDDGVILFQYASPDEALELVQGGKADAAWIFPGDLTARLIRFSEKNSSEGIVRVVERESTVPLRLAREKLSSVLYEHCTEYVYLRYLRDCVPETAEVSDEVLLAYLNSSDVTGELFAFYDIEGNYREEKTNYLTSPIRGLLATVAALTALVTAMYYQKDRDRGLFSLLPEKHQLVYELGYQLISSLNVVLAIFLALLISGLNGNVWRELILVGLFSLNCCAFGMVMRSVFGGRTWLGSILPAMIVLMLTICPVFFNISSFYFLQLLLPPSYYIQGIYSTPYMMYSIGYTVLMMAICFALDFLKRLRLTDRNADRK